MFFANSPILATLFAQAEGAPAPAVDAAQSAQQGGGSPVMIIAMVLFFAAFWFLFIQPQRKQQKEIARKQSELKTGDRVVTTGGIIGKVVSIDGSKVTLQVSEGVRIPFQRQAVVGFLGDEASSDKKD
ncbi:MAG: preprotein translocase subunit YajC [Puniceicoccales bacterium]|jgi:preprotein translocase subunit YajC|nr:preprotein translocase subunit YajC [Puniceicoccales bacterium]